MLVLNETNRVKTNKNCKALSAILYLSLARMFYYKKWFERASNCTLLLTLNYMVVEAKLSLV